MRAVEQAIEPMLSITNSDVNRNETTRARLRSWSKMWIGAPTASRHYVLTETDAIFEHFADPACGFLLTVAHSRLAHVTRHDFQSLHGPHVSANGK